MPDDAVIPDRSSQARLRCLIAMGLGVGGMAAFYEVAARQDNQGYAVFALFWVLPGLVSLGLGLRSLVRADFGSAAAWVTCALPLFTIAACLSLALMFTTDAAGVVVVTAERGYWFPFVFFIASLVVLLTAIRAVKVAGRSP